jgi:hypothetical protein
VLGWAGKPGMGAGRDWGRAMARRLLSSLPPVLCCAVLCWDSGWSGGVLRDGRVGPGPGQSRVHGAGAWQWQWQWQWTGRGRGRISGGRIHNCGTMGGWGQGRRWHGRQWQGQCGHGRCRHGGMDLGGWMRPWPSRVSLVHWVSFCWHGQAWTRTLARQGLLAWTREAGGMDRDSGMGKDCRNKQAMTRTSKDSDKQGLGQARTLAWAGTAGMGKQGL